MDLEPAAVGGVTGGGWVWVQICDLGEAGTWEAGLESESPGFRLGGLPVSSRWPRGREFSLNLCSSFT